MQELITGEEDVSHFSLRYICAASPLFRSRWGGHYFLIDGPVKGGRIVGEYPEELWTAMKAWGRRVVPTTPWDSIWGSVAEWMGVSDAEGLREVCPNREKFDSETLFDAATMFTNFLCQYIVAVRVL